MDPDQGTVSSMVDMIGSALAIRSQYRPRYRFVEDLKGNHVFAVTPSADGAYEYLIAGAWSEGAVLQTWEAFQRYVLTTAREYESPVRARVVADERHD